MHHTPTSFTSSALSILNTQTPLLTSPPFPISPNNRPPPVQAYLTVNSAAKPTSSTPFHNLNTPHSLIIHSASSFHIPNTIKTPPKFDPLHILPIFPRYRPPHVQAYITVYSAAEPTGLTQFHNLDTPQSLIIHFASSFHSPNTKIPLLTWPPFMFCPFCLAIDHPLFKPTR